MLRSMTDPTRLPSPSTARRGTGEISTFGLPSQPPVSRSWLQAYSQSSPRHPASLVDLGLPSLPDGVK
jgi:hypothetical protein